MLGAYLDGRRLGKVMEDLGRLALAKLSTVEIDANLDAAIGRACERLHAGPVG